MQNTEIKLVDIIRDGFQKSYAYEEYLVIIRQLVEQTSTSGEVVNENLINFTLLNERRMLRLNKTILIPEDIKSVFLSYNRKVIWRVLTESWCGDAAQIVPVIAKVAALNPLIELKILFRDQNLDLMQQYLTNGSLSIPKLIVTDKETSEVIAHWGPRPAEAAKMVSDYKLNFGVITPRFKEELQMWYTRDKGLSTMKELAGLLH